MQEKVSTVYNRDIMVLNYFSKNGEILSIDQAVIPLSNIAYQYGFGVYENIKVRNKIIYFTDQHIERLFTSAQTIGLQHAFSREQIKKWINDLMGKLSNYVIPAQAGIQNTVDPRVKPEDDNRKSIGASYNLKFILLGGNDPVLYIIPLAPKFPDRKLYSDGAKTLTVQMDRIFPNAKTLNMLPSYLAYTKAREHDCYDALLLDAYNNIVEGTRTNFFVIKDKIITTAPKEKVLEGVTKLTVLAVAQKNGFTVEEKDIPLAEIENYDGAFLTSTGAKIVPIIQIDDFRFLQIPEKLKELMHLYDAFLSESKGEFHS